MIFFFFNIRKGHYGLSLYCFLNLVMKLLLFLSAKNRFRDSDMYYIRAFFHLPFKCNLCSRMHFIVFNEGLGLMRISQHFVTVMFEIKLSTFSVQIKKKTSNAVEER